MQARDKSNFFKSLKDEFQQRNRLPKPIITLDNCAKHDTDNRHKRYKVKRLRDRSKSTTRMSIRRTMAGQFRLKADKKTVKIFLYCLGVAANNYNIKLHSLTIRGDHYKLITSDQGQDSDLSQFHKDLHTDLTRAFNYYQNSKGSIWANEKTQEIDLLSLEDFEEFFVGGRVDPVREGLIKDPENWPILSIGAQELGNFCQTINRPDCFKKTKKKPDSVTVKFEMPPCVNEWVEGESQSKKIRASQGRSHYRDRLQAKVQIKTKEAQETREKHGLGYLGKQAIKSIRPDQSLKDAEKEKGIIIKDVELLSDIEELERRTNCPIHKQAKDDYKQFCKDYKKALELWLSDQPAIFPKGTYKMRKVFRVKCRE